MDKYTASNGITFIRASDSSWRWEAGGLPKNVTAALRELFQAERDEELGRWRWPENPDYVVYKDGVDSRLITVMRESVARIRKKRRDNLGFSPDHAEQFEACAEAYFEAHPERKPWDDAQEGEVWIVTPSKAFTLGEQINYPAIFQAGMFRDHGGSWGAEDLTAARRIWPEPD